VLYTLAAALSFIVILRLLASSFALPAPDLIRGEGEMNLVLNPQSSVISSFTPDLRLQILDCGWFSQRALGFLR
ncbi:MAG: hypothetical protein V3S76_02565, partial [Candidatus Bipolaricaulota bacterium]